MDAKGQAYKLLEKFIKATRERGVQNDPLTSLRIKFPVMPNYDPSYDYYFCFIIEDLGFDVYDISVGLEAQKNEESVLVHGYNSIVIDMEGDKIINIEPDFDPYATGEEAWTKLYEILNAFEPLL